TPKEARHLTGEVTPVAPRAAQKGVQYSCRGSYRTSHNRDTDLWTPWHPWLSTFLGRASRTRRGRAGRGGEPIEGVTMSTTTAIPVSLVLPHITQVSRTSHARRGRETSRGVGDQPAHGRGGAHG